MVGVDAIAVGLVVLGARKVEEEKELDEGGGGRGAETMTGGAMPADGVQPERVREVEIFPRGKGSSEKTAGAVGDAKDAGTWGCPPGGGGDRRNRIQNRCRKVVGSISFVGGVKGGTGVRGGGDGGMMRPHALHSSETSHSRHYP